MDMLSIFPNQIIRSVLLDTVEEKLQSKSYKIDVKCASEGGENNFVGIIHRVSFSKEEADNSSTEAAENLILKVAPQNNFCRNKFNSRQLFLREIHMYEEVGVLRSIVCIFKQSINTT